MSFLSKYIKYLGQSAEEKIEQSVEAFLPKKKRLVYLDCGCDDGVKTVSRAKVIGTKTVIGIEEVPERKSLAQKNGVKTYSFDLNLRWGLKDESIDVITATEVIEHLYDLDNFFEEARRVLKKGGRIILSTENLASYHNIVALLLGNQPYTGPYLSRKHKIGHRPGGKFYAHEFYMRPHISVMTAIAMKQLFKANSFSLLEFNGVSFYPWPPFIANMLSKLDKNHASYMVMSAKKI